MAEHQAPLQSQEASPLMRPVTYNGQTYYTSHYFHRQYLANCQAEKQTKKKYERHHHFVRLLRGIPAYGKYLQLGNILEIRWVARREQGSKPDSDLLLQIKDLEPLFAEAGYRPIHLLDATAQVAMTHHLDDELSQKMSVAANTQVARDAIEDGMLREEMATRILEAIMKAGDILDVPRHITQVEAVKMVTARTGISLVPILKKSRANDNVPDESQMLEPTDLGRALGVPSGTLMNKLLEQLGWQWREFDGAPWRPTTTGRPHCTTHHWIADHGHKDGDNWKWNVISVRRALAERGMLPQRHRDMGHGGATP